MIHIWLFTILNLSSYRYFLIVKISSVKLKHEGHKVLGPPIAKAQDNAASAHEVKTLVQRSNGENGGTTKQAGCKTQALILRNLFDPFLSFCPT